MTTLASDEKSTLVMVYTQDALVRGEVVTKQSVRVSIWLRTEGAPHYFHLINAQKLFFGGGPVRSSNHAEIYVPVASSIAFHIAPPAHEPLDYEEGEKNRAVQLVTAGVGSFVFKGAVRYSSQTGFSSSLEMVKGWLSMYETEITNPGLPQMPAILVPMLLANPSQVTFAV
jgi:hypothetical protein